MENETAIMARVVVVVVRSRETIYQSSSVQSTTPMVGIFNMTYQILFIFLDAIDGDQLLGDKCM